MTVKPRLEELLRWQRACYEALATWDRRSWGGTEHAATRDRPGDAVLHAAQRRAPGLCLYHVAKGPGRVYAAVGFEVVAGAFQASVRLES